MLLYVLAVAAVLVVLIFSGTGAGKRGAGASELYDSEEVQFVQILNHYRESHGVRPVLLSDTVSVASEHHSQDMANYGFFAHRTVESAYYLGDSVPWASAHMRAEGTITTRLWARTSPWGAHQPKGALSSGATPLPTTLRC